MVDFNSSEYEQMIGDLIHDTFYVELSKRGKIKGIRQFSEILVRKILNVGSDKKLMLGQVQQDFKNELNLLREGRKDDLLEIIEKIRPLGNDGTHTQHTAEFSDDELNKVKDGLLDLYAYLFIDYFLKYPMDLLSPAEVMFDFSLLPPIVRYKTLKYLYEKEPNLQIANRYCLSIIKTYDKERALKWLEKEKSKLLSIPYPTDNEIQEYICKRGIKDDSGNIIINLALPNYNNVYSLLMDKLKDPRTSANESGKMYSEFEKAKTYYLSNRSDTEGEEINRLRDLMDFVYLGREALVWKFNDYYLQV